MNMLFFIKKYGADIPNIVGCYSEHSFHTRVRMFFGYVRFMMVFGYVRFYKTNNDLILPKAITCFKFLELKLSHNRDRFWQSTSLTLTTLTFSLKFMKKIPIVNSQLLCLNTTWVV